MLLSTTNISKISLTHHVSSEISEIGSSFSVFFSCLSSLLPSSLPVFLPSFFFFSPLLSFSLTNALFGRQLCSLLFHQSCIQWFVWVRIQAKLIHCLWLIQLLCLFNLQVPPLSLSFAIYFWKNCSIYLIKFPKSILKMFIFRTRPKEEGRTEFGACVLETRVYPGAVSGSVRTWSWRTAPPHQQAQKGALCWRLRKIMHRKCMTHRRFSIDPPPLLFIYFYNLY